MSNDSKITKELLKLNSSIIHDALRTEGYINQTLPPDIKPLTIQK